MPDPLCLACHADRIPKHALFCDQHTSNLLEWAEPGLERAYAPLRPEVDPGVALALMDRAAARRESAKMLEELDA